MKRCHKCGKFHKSNAEIENCGKPQAVVEKTEQKIEEKKENIIPETPEKVVEKVIEIVKEPERKNENTMVRGEAKGKEETKNTETEQCDEIEQNKNNPFVLMLIVLLIIVVCVIVFFRDEILQRIFPKEQK